MNDHDDENTESRDRDVGQGYPEEAPPGTGGIDADEHAEDDVADELDESGANAKRHGDPGQATGNPHAAGADEGT